MSGPNPSLPNYGQIGYFHESHGISPSKAAKMLVGAARAMHPPKGQRPAKISGRGIVKSAGTLFHQNGGKK